jgi:EAL domain-containing protein (putative c-di-GMP-specific phosphodiesterase class I)
MYGAKVTGKNSVRLFEPWMRDQARARFELQSDLNGALERGEFVLHYQPSFEISTGRLEGFEALLRWQHPTLGLVGPEQFIPLAEESGLIVSLGRFVLQEATRQLGEWRKAHRVDGELSIAVNVSARQLRSRHFLDEVRQAIEVAGIGAGQLVLEVTESMLVHEPEEVAKVLQLISDSGVRIAIDDFGTGYSSLAYLQNLPIDILKVDKSFVSPTGGIEEEGRRLLGAILHLAQTLGLRSVAEGVEESEQFELLRRGGCDVGQGFLWSPPVAADIASRLLSQGLFSPASGQLAA